MDMVQFFSMLQLIGGVILSIGYIPQIIKMIRTRSVDDFSKMYLGSIFFGIVLMEMYAVYMYLVIDVAEMQSFFITNTASTILSGTEFILLMMFATKKPKKLK